MKNIIRKILSFIGLAICVISFCTPVFAVQANIVTGDIGDYGVWTTEHNREELVTNIQNDMVAFESGFEREYVDTGVPLSAKLGILFIRALSYVAGVLDNSLVRFVNIFLVIAFLFWIMFESYKLITDDKTKAMPTVENMFRKGLILAIWLVLLGGGLQEFFGMIMGPIVSLGSYISNIILNSVTESGGFVLSDNCAAIRAYAVSHMNGANTIAPETAASIMCVPARLAGFYYGAIKFGWSLFVSGFGTSTFSVLIGLVLTCLFLFTAYKFVFIMFGVIADLFLVVIMLPFTAIAETVNKTSYAGIAGNIYNGFLGLFQSSNLSSQIKKFVDATIYFISFSIMIAIGGALLASAISLNTQTHTITIINGDIVTLLITGALVAYIASHAEEFAKSIGGGIEYALGTDLQKDIKTLYTSTKQKATEFIKALKK
jgi:hypothetical protein